MRGGGCHFPSSLYLWKQQIWARGRWDCSEACWALSNHKDMMMGTHSHNPRNLLLVHHSAPLFYFIVIIIVFQSDTLKWSCYSCQFKWVHPEGRNCPKKKRSCVVYLFFLKISRIFKVWKQMLMKQRRFFLWTNNKFLRWLAPNIKKRRRPGAHLRGCSYKTPNYWAQSCINYSQLFTRK